MKYCKTYELLSLQNISIGRKTCKRKEGDLRWIQNVCKEKTRELRGLTTAALVKKIKRLSRALQGKSVLLVHPTVVRSAGVQILHCATGLYLLLFSSLFLLNLHSLAKHDSYTVRLGFHGNLRRLWTLIQKLCMVKHLIYVSRKGNLLRDCWTK